MTTICELIAAHERAYDVLDAAAKRRLFISDVLTCGLTANIIAAYGALALDEDNQRACTDAGLEEADAVFSASADFEIAARVELVLARPHDAGEAAIKRAYIERSPPFYEKWIMEDENSHDALIERLCEPLISLATIYEPKTFKESTA